MAIFTNVRLPVTYDFMREHAREGIICLTPETKFISYPQ